MPGRNYTIGNGYRYSINGQEKTPEIAPNTTTAEFWQYDARIVRRWNVDPKPQTYSSPYATFDNSPVWKSDPLGDTTKRALVPYMYPVSSNGNWVNGALLLPGNTYVKAYNTFATTTNEAVDLAQKSSSNGLGPGLMGKLQEWGEDLKDWWSGTEDYHTKTPASQQLKDAGNWISNPDNVYGAISDGAIIYSTGRSQGGISKNWSLIDNVPEWTTTPTKKLQVGEYKPMAKSNAGTGLSADHIPSFAAVKKMTESKLGRQLTKVEATELRNKTLTIVYETKIHQGISRTFAGRNSASQIAFDAADILGSISRDIKALTPSLQKAGYSIEDINAAQQTLMNKYK